MFFEQHLVKTTIIATSQQHSSSNNNNSKLGIVSSTLITRKGKQRERERERKQQRTNQGAFSADDLADLDQATTGPLVACKLGQQGVAGTEPAPEVV